MSASAPDPVLVEAVRDVLHSVGAFSGDTPWLLAVSGGRDSMVLLDLCFELGGASRVRAATVDHGLRPFTAEAGLVARWCGERGIPWRLLRLAPGLRGRAADRGAEAQARTERYDALFALADEVGASRVLTAHTRDDQAETVLLRLLRGAGPMGLAGIQAGSSGRLLRPLLGVGRDAVAAHADRRTLPWVRDPGNEDLDIRRCRVRAILPALEAAAPGAAAVLARDAAVAADHAAGLRAWALEHFDLPSDASLPLDLPLARVGRGAVARVRIHALLRALGAADGLTRSHMEALADIASGRDGRAADLPGDLVAVCRGLTLHLGPRDATPCPDIVEIPGPGRHPTPLGLLEITEEARGRLIADGRREIRFDRAAVRFPLRLRAPRRGERMAPWGLGGHTRLVSRLLADEKVPRHRRALPRVLEDAEGHVIWLVGCRRGVAAPVSEGTAVVLLARLTEVR